MNGTGAFGRQGRCPFDRVARIYDVAFAVTELLIGRIFRRHLGSLGLPPGGRILDVGCGTGWLAIRLAREGYAVVAVDSSRAMIARARAKQAKADPGLRLEFREADGRSLPFAEGSFDLVTLVAVLHGPAAEGRLALLAEARRVSRGKVLVHDYPPLAGPRGISAPFLRLLEAVERSDFENFVREGTAEMASLFPSVAVRPVAPDSSWYILGRGGGPG